MHRWIKLTTSLAICTCLPTNIHAPEEVEAPDAALVEADRVRLRVTAVNRSQLQAGPALPQPQFNEEFF